MTTARLLSELPSEVVRDWPAPLTLQHFTSQPSLTHHDCGLVAWLSVSLSFLIYHADFIVAVVPLQ